jgi:hypothetical protein
MDPEDLAARAAQRSYPTFGPDDDDFHDEVMSDHWWETETQWFSWSVPERAIAGWTYCQARPNAQLFNGGVWVWDASASLAWDLPYHVEYSGLKLPPRAERDMRDFQWPSGVHVQALEPLQRYAISYHDEGALELDLTFDALIAPNPHPTGVAPFIKGVHFDQPGHVTGTMTLNGETISVDCYAVRDRSWGPRPQGRPRRKPPAEVAQTTGVQGVGYSFAVASPTEAWLIYSIPTMNADPIVCGYLLRDGVYAHILGGTRVMEVDPTHGWPERITVDAFDDHGRRLQAEGNTLSRFWRGRGGDTLMHWKWENAEGHGEDQTYLSKTSWLARRDEARRQAGPNN